MASNRCPNCRKHFQTLADEVGSYDCPHCGWDPAHMPYSDSDWEEDEDDPPGLYANEDEERRAKELMKKEETNE